MNEVKNWLLIPAFILILIGAGYLGFAKVFPFISPPQIALEKNILDLEDPLIIKFDRSVIRHKVESSFTITPNVIGQLGWRDNNLVFNPVKPWQPGEKYKISFAGISQLAASFHFASSFETIAYPEIQEINPGDGKIVGPMSPIEFHFNQGRSNVHLDFKVAPAFNYSLSVDPERKHFQLLPQEPLRQDANYQVVAYESFKGQGEQLWYPKEIANFQFKTIPPPLVEKIVPGDKEEDVKEFTPIRIYFNKPMKPEEGATFLEITPQAAGDIKFEEEGKIAVFTPSRWALNTNYSIKIKGGWRAQDGTYLDKDFLSVFHSFDSSGLVHKAAAATANPQIKEGRYVDINLSRQILTIFEDGKNRGNYKVSSGKRGMATPTGMHHILSKRKRAWSKKYGLFMPYWMQFTRQGHGVHELPEWPSGYKEGANHLGIPVSHGCVRLGVGAAETVYGFVSAGTPVYIHY